MHPFILLDSTSILEEDTLHDGDLVVHLSRMMSSWRGLFSFLRTRRSRLSLYCEDLRVLHRKFLFVVLLFFSAAQHTRFVDSQGRSEVVSFFSLLRSGVGYILEAVGGAILLPLFFLSALFLRSIPSTARSFSRDDRVSTIAYIRTDYWGSTQRVGGSFSHTDGFLHALIRAGKRIMVISPGRVSSLDETNVPWYRILPRYFLNFPELATLVYNGTLFFHCRRIFLKHRPSFIYARHDGFIIAPLLLARSLGIPLLLEVNGLETWVREKWGRLTFRRLCRLYEEIVLRGAHRLFVVSRVLADDLMEFGVPRDRIVINPNGVDIASLEGGDAQLLREQYHIRNQTVVGFVGTFGEWHGVEVLARAIPTVLVEQPQTTFLLIGEGKLLSNVKHILAESQCLDRVIFTGIIPHKEMKNYLMFCDILVSPHIPNQDGTKFFGSPTKLFEYMAIGKGIVASRLNQLAEVLEHNKTAWLVEPGNPDALAKGILCLINDRELAERLGRAAKDVARRTYTWDHNVSRVLAEYTYYAS